jgi:small subunit ribosomal protein S27e
MEENNKEKSGFIKVKCHKCGNEQVIFGRAATQIKCLGKGCDETIAVPRGGKAAVNAEIIELY